MAKVVKVKVTRNGQDRIVSGTVVELTEYFAYTLECGAAYAHEKGNKKINRYPKTIKSLITNLNNAVSNCAANGSASTYYS